MTELNILIPWCALVSSSSAYATNSAGNSIGGINFNSQLTEDEINSLIRITSPTQRNQSVRP